MDESPYLQEDLSPEQDMSHQETVSESESASDVMIDEEESTPNPHTVLQHPHSEEMQTVFEGRGRLAT